MPEAVGRLARQTLAFVKLTRPQNALGVVVSFTIGYCLVNNKLISLDLWVGIIVLCLVHSAATVLNDIEDYAIDQTNMVVNGLQTKQLSLRQANNLVMALAATAMAIAWISPHRAVHLALAISLIVLSWAYDKPPLLLSRRPKSSIIILGLCYGALPLVYGYALKPGLPVGLWLPLVAAWFVQRASLSIMKDYKDSRGDQAHAKHTFYLTYGKKLTERISISFSLIAYIVAVLVLIRLRRLMPEAIVGLVLIGAIIGRNIWIRFKLHSTNEDRMLNQIFHRSLAGQNLFEFAVLVWLLRLPN